MTQYDQRQTKNLAMIVLSVCVAVLLIQDNGTFFYTGLAGIILILCIALFSPWLGMLALYPLAFALPPAPPSIGLRESAFAILLGIIFFLTFSKLVRRSGFKYAAKFYGYPLLLGAVLLGVNLGVAIANGVHPTEWARGVTPFLFIYAFLPISVLIGDNEDNIFWLGTSIATMIFLITGSIVFYYFSHALWRPYWLITINGDAIKLTRDIALETTGAMGPMRDRITMFLAQATDAMLPVGLVSGFVICTFATSKKIMAATGAMIIISLSAILITFTRSMLLSAILVIIAFTVFTTVYRKELRPKLLVMIVLTAAIGLSFIACTGMQDMWIGRMSTLAQSSAETVKNIATAAPDHSISLAKVDFNVSSRLDEYQLAWKMYQGHPLLGNGLGIKHEMTWETSDGASFSQLVAYVHNWPLYMLMVGGICGLILYALLLLAPAIVTLSSARTEPTSRTVIRTTLLTMAVYGMFFAVFRLVTFNLIVAAAWGAILSRPSVWSYDIFSKNRATSKEAMGTLPYSRTGSSIPPSVTSEK